MIALIIIFGILSAWRILAVNTRLIEILQTYSLRRTKRHERCKIRWNFANHPRTLSLSDGNYDTSFSFILLS